MKCVFTFQIIARALVESTSVNDPIDLYILYIAFALL